MKKSSQIHLGLLTTLALSLSSCRTPREMQRCVDEHQVVVDDQFCDSNRGDSNRHRWYYGGGGSYSAGSPASGGSFEPHSGFSSVRGNGVTSSSVSRGGFGSSAAHSGGSGE